MTDVQELWADCEPLSKEEVALITGCSEIDLFNLVASTEERYFGIDSKDRVFAFLQWSRPPKFVYEVRLCVNGKFTDIRTIKELYPIYIGRTEIK